MAHFFGVEDNQYVLLAHFGFPNLTYSDYYIKLTPNFEKMKVDKIMVYSNIVAPTVRLGGHLTNLLDVISPPEGNTLNRAHVSGSIKPLRNHTMDSITMVITDVDGDKISFEKGAQSTFEVHIAPM